MMSLTNEIPVDALSKQNCTYALVDSGSAVTAAPWEFAEQIALDESQKLYGLKAVGGQSIKHYGKRKVPANIQGSEGEVLDAVLDTEIADVNKVVISVSTMAKKGSGSYFPPNDDCDCWLWEDGVWSRLNGPCIRHGSHTAPLIASNGVYWLELSNVGNGAQQAHKQEILCAPVDDEELFDRMMEPYDGEPSEEDPDDPPEAAGVHEDEINEEVPVVVPRKPPAMPSEEIVRHTSCFRSCQILKMVYALYCRQRQSSSTSSWR
jgi:hypothetical protein